MNFRTLHDAALAVGETILTVFVLILLSTGFLVAQATLSAGPPPLYQVKTIYVAPSSDDFVLLVKARLENWGAIAITSKSEEADTILTCRTESALVPAKVMVRRTIAEVTLVDRHSQKPIWKTTKLAFDRNGLADDVVEQLKQDWRKSASAY